MTTTKGPKRRRQQSMPAQAQESIIYDLHEEMLIAQKLNPTTPEAAETRRWWEALGEYDQLLRDIAYYRSVAVAASAKWIGEEWSASTDPAKWSQAVECLIHGTAVPDGAIRCPADLHCWIITGLWTAHFQSAAEEVAKLYPHLHVCSPNLSRRHVRDAIWVALWAAADCTPEAIRANWTHAGLDLSSGVGVHPRVVGPPVWGEVRRSCIGVTGWTELRDGIDGIQGRRQMHTDQMPITLVLICWPGARKQDARKMLDNLWGQAEGLIEPRPGKKGRNQKDAKDYALSVAVYNHYLQCKRLDPLLSIEAFKNDAAGKRVTEIAAYWPHFDGYTLASRRSAFSARFDEADSWLRRNPSLAKSPNHENSAQ